MKGGARLRFAWLYPGSHRWKISAVILTFAFTWLARAEVDLPEGPGKTILENSCEECHGAERIVNKAWAKEKWRVTVKDMVARGATLKPDETEILIDYLATYFGPDNRP